MSKLDDIKNQLAQRLEKQSEQQERPASVTIHDAAENKVKSTRKIAADPVKNGVGATRGAQSSGSEGVVKLSVSLYNFDIQCLDQIREFMRKNGVRNLSDSEALRLACRAVKIDTAFLGIHQDMQKEDRRRR